MTDCCRPTRPAGGRRTRLLALWTLLALSAWLRSAGLFRGLEDPHGYIFHPDTPKQINALHNYLNNRYIWYHDSWFYDGYPLFLNHVDEWIIRPVRAAQVVLHNHLYPEAPLTQGLTHRDLYAWARVLRVLYGLLTVLAVYATARALRLREPWPLAAAAFVALHPVSLVVSHAASGDIGVDLFSALAFLCLAAACPRRAPLWWMGAGIATAFAFASKYHGALAGLVPALALLAALRPRARPWRSIFARGCGYAAGLLAGLPLAIPQLVTATSRTVADIETNFRRIRAYNAPREFLDLPFLDQWTRSLGNNLPTIGAGLGLVALLVAVAGLGWTALALWRNREAPADDADTRRTGLEWALAGYLVAALFAATGGKPAVQVFHFSFLVVPLALVAAATLERITRAGGGVAAAVAALAIAVPLGLTTASETFFWSREDVRRVAEAARENLADPRGSYVYNRSIAGATRLVRRVEVEPANPAEFRNRPHAVLVDGAAVWTALGAVPAPDIPWRLRHDWMIANGPQFPHNDRCFELVPGQSRDWHVVWHREPESVRFGLRAGALPVFLELEVGGERRHLRLDPHTQRVETFHAPRTRVLPADKLLRHGAWLVSVRTHAAVGRSSIALLTSDAEAQQFALFGGDASARPPFVDATDLAPHLAAVGDYEYAARMRQAPHRIAAPDALLLAFDKRRHLLLPAGVYRLRLETERAEPGTRIAVELRDAAERSAEPIARAEVTPEAGVGVLDIRLDKPFAPYACTVVLKCLTGSVSLIHWRLAPDAAQVVADVQAHARGDAAPEWLRPHPAQWTAGDPADPPLAVFGGAAELLRARWPDTLPAGEIVPAEIRFRMRRADERLVEEVGLFVHLVDATGTVRGQFGLRLRSAVWGDHAAPPVPIRIGADVPPGEYEARLGVWNERTRQRLALTEAAPGSALRGHVLRVGRVTVTAP